MRNKKTVFCFLVFIFMLIGSGITAAAYNAQALSAEGDEKAAAGLRYEDFKALSNEEQISVFAKLSSPEIYALVKDSDSENWPVTAYDLVTENNAKDFIVLNEYNGSLSFNLNWPIYGGYDPDTIASIGDLSGTVTVSRDGGDGGYSMCYGRNEDGTLANNSQRAIPKTSATVRTGLLNIDRYKQAVEVITSEEFERTSTEETDQARITALQELGFTEEAALNLMSDYSAWLTRPEIIGENNIAEGAIHAGRQIEPRYGYYGKAAAWEVSDLKLVGGCDQMTTVFSWGTLNSSGLITEAGTETIE
jgi:hypothetical protein